MKWKKIHPETITGITQAEFQILLMVCMKGIHEIYKGADFAKGSIITGESAYPIETDGNICFVKVQFDFLAGAGVAKKLIQVKYHDLSIGDYINWINQARA